MQPSNVTSLHLRLAICGDTFQVYASVHDLVTVEAGERSDIETDTDVVTVVRGEVKVGQSGLGPCCGQSRQIRPWSWTLVRDKLTSHM